MIVETRSAKGGVGKSLMLKFIVDYLIGDKNRIFLLDTDHANKADIARAHADIADDIGMEIQAMEMNDTDDFSSYLRLIRKKENEGFTVLINHGGGNEREAEIYGKGLAVMCGTGNVDYRTIWMTDADDVCMEQYEDFINATKGAIKTTLVHNMGLGDRLAFKRIKPSNYNVPIVEMPALPNIIKRIVKDKNLPICQISSEMDPIDWAMVEEYVEKVRKSARKAVESASLPERQG